MFLLAYGRVATPRRVCVDRRGTDSSQVLRGCADKSGEFYPRVVFGSERLFLAFAFQRRERAIGLRFCLEKNKQAGKTETG